MRQRLDVETLVPGVPFPWPMEDGHNSFVIETKPKFSLYCGYTGEWQKGINVGIFSAPTMDDIQYKRAGTRRLAIVDIYKFRESKRGKRSGKTILYREIYFDRNDPRPPCDLTLLLIEQTEGRDNWERIR